MEKVIFITGATSGLGLALAKYLALKQNDIRLILHGKCAKKAKQITHEVLSINNQIELEYFNADLTDLKQVVSMCHKIKTKYDKIDLLINNAGVAKSDSFQLTKDGFEKIAQVNFISHFLATNILIDVVNNSVDGKIIFVSSSAYGNQYHNTFNCYQTWSEIEAYKLSKFAVNCFMYNLSKKEYYPNVSSVAIHPASRMKTGLVDLDSYQDSIEIGVQNIFDLIEKPSILLNGKYFYKNTILKLNDKCEAIQEWRQITSQIFTSNLITSNSKPL